MRSLFLSPRLAKGYGESMIFYSLAFCQATIAFGATIEHYGLERFLDPPYAMAWSIPILGGLIAFVFRLLKYSTLHSVLLAGGAALVLQANYLQQAHDPLWLVGLLFGWWLIMRFFSEGPEPNGWEDSLATIRRR